jgi:hypothetical protein
MSDGLSYATFHYNLSYFKRLHVRQLQSQSAANILRQY